MQEQTLSDVQEALDRGEKETALQLVDQILTANPTADGWTLAARIVDAPADKLKCLEKALEIDPNYEEARRMYSDLGELPPPRTTGTPAPPVAQPKSDLERASAVATVRKEGDQTVYVEGVYEMLWDCRFCGTKKLLGKTHKFCPVCGAQQDPEWRYFPSDSEKVAVKDHVYVGADKTCPNCGSLVAANAEYCGRCGAPQSEAAAVKLQESRAAGVGERFMTEDLDARQVAEAYGRPKAKPLSNRPKWLFPLIGVAVVGVIAFLLAFFFIKREETGYVSGFNWERSIDIERYSAVQGRQECPAPADAYSVSRSYEQVGSRQVPDGETCSSRQVDQGDGTFRSERVCTTRYRSEPVYGYMCSYTVNRWGYSRTSSATGDKETPPAWPATNATGCLSLGCERERDREEHYRVIITSGERTYQCDLPFQQWQNTPLEQTYSFKVGVIGNRIDCGSLEPLG